MAKFLQKTDIYKEITFFLWYIKKNTLSLSAEINYYK